MGLQKTYETASGVTGMYWKITNVFVDKAGMTINPQISLFLDKSASDLGKACLMSLSFTFEVTSQEMAGDILALSYVKIKAKIAETSTVGVDGSVLPAYPLWPQLHGAIDA